MTLPYEFHTKGSTQVYKLNKSLHNLKQALRQWFSKFFNAFLTQGFIQSKSDYTLFARHQNGSHISLLVYVDDIILTRYDLNAIKALINKQNAQFKLMDLGSPKFLWALRLKDPLQGHLFPKDIMHDSFSQILNI